MAYLASLLQNISDRVNKEVRTGMSVRQEDAIYSVFFKDGIMYFNVSALCKGRRNTMRKAVTVFCATMIMFAFAVSGSLAQMVTWDSPKLITNSEVFEGIEVDLASNELVAIVGGSPVTITLSSDAIDWVQATDVSLDTPPVDEANSPSGVTYVIDADTVGIHVRGSTYVAFPAAEQPKVPAEGSPLAPMVGEYKFIAAGPDGKLYVLFEDTEAEGSGNRYLLVGNPAEATVRITPRSLNQGSKGKWVTVKISGLPEGYAVGDINLDTVCVTAVGTDYTITPVCQASGPSNNRNKKKVMLKMSREELAEAIPDVTGTVDLTVIGTVGEAALPFFATDTIKTKAPKK